MAPFHRDAMTIPTTASERRELIEWLVKHPLWRGDNDETEFDDCVDVDFFPFINPTTGTVDSDHGKNTVMAVRLEAGRDQTHDVRLDLWAPTVEIAFLELAARVAYYFDDDGKERGIDHLACKHEDFDSEQYCRACGLIRNHWNFWAAGGEATLPNELLELHQSDSW